MRTLAIAGLVFAVGCADHGTTPMDKGFETPRFQPLICTSGMPNEPTCPVNLVDLGEFGAPARFTFVYQLLGTGVYLAEIRIVAGAEGIVLDGFTLRVWTNETTPTELPFDPIELRPNESLTIGTRALVIENTTAPLSLRATSAGPFR